MDENDLPQDVLEEIRAIRSKYARDLVEKIARIQALIDAISLDPGASARKELHRLVHSLAGGAATFGLQSVGEAARAMEEYLEESVIGAGPIEAGSNARLNELTAKIRQASEAHS